MCDAWSLAYAFKDLYKNGLLFEEKRLNFKTLEENKYKKDNKIIKDLMLPILTWI